MTAAPRWSSTPTVALVTGGTIAAGTETAPVTLSWTGADVGPAGVKRYILEQSVDGGAYTEVTMPLTPITSIGLNLTFGMSYQFRIRAIDRAGNESAPAISAPFSSLGRQESDPAVVFSTSPAWKSVPNVSAYGGTARRISALGATATFSFTGKRVGLIANMHELSGLAEISIDGAVVGTVDLYRSSPQAATLVFVSDTLTAGSHTLTVRVLATHSAGSSGNQVEIDGFVVIP